MVKLTAINAPLSNDANFFLLLFLKMGNIYSNQDIHFKNVSLRILPKKARAFWRGQYV